jgi:voltage-gated potassium channel
VAVERLRRRRAVRPTPISATARLQRGVLLLGLVTLLGSIAYVAIGLEFEDALYQTIVTVATVGYREIGPDEVIDSARYRVVTMVLVVTGVGTALYTLGVMLESIVEGRLTDQIWRRRMERSIAAMSDHVIVCGWGRVGKTIARSLMSTGTEVVVVDVDPDRLEGIELPFVEGDATDDEVLAAAAIGKARALVAALDSDAANLFVTLSGRSLRTDLFIVARARIESAEAKLLQAGADRVVNPQHIGGQRIAAMILQPSVTDFLDVVMHDADIEFRLAEVEVGADSGIAGRSLRDAHIRDRTGALVLAMRDSEGRFRSNPSPETEILAGEVLIAIGTPEQLDALRAEVSAG